MKKIILYILVLSLLIVSVSALDKHDFVELVENTDHCFDCHTIYKITKAADVSLSKLGFDFKNAKDEFVVHDYETSYLKTETYIDYIDEYESCIKTMNVNISAEVEIYEN